MVKVIRQRRGEKRGAWPLVPSVYAIGVAVSGSEVFIGTPHGPQQNFQEF